MSLPDNRIRFPATRIDFTNDVGDTGQDHDQYPAPGGQARYDWMRSFLIGLLSCQSSTAEPSQYREGTPWFDLNSNTLKVMSGGVWVSAAEVIGLTPPATDGSVVSLAGWYAAVQDLLVGLAPEIVFSGQCNADGITTIEVPLSLQSQLASDSRIFLYINGSLVRPTNCTLIGSPSPTTIKLSGLSLSNGDSFTAIIRRVPPTTYYSTPVIVP